MCIVHILYMHNALELTHGSDATSQEQGSISRSEALTVPVNPIRIQHLDLLVGIPTV